MRIPYEEREGLPSMTVVVPEAVLVRPGTPGSVRRRAGIAWALDRLRMPFCQADLNEFARILDGRNLSLDSKLSRD